MGEVPLYLRQQSWLRRLQGYLDHGKPLPPGTLQEAMPRGLMVLLWGGGQFLMSEVML